MNPTIQQFWAVTRTELIIQWRQRSLLFGALPCLAIGIWFILGIRASQSQPGSIILDEAQLAASGVIGVAYIIHIFSLLMYPILLAETLPKDRQWGLEDLTRSWPLPPSTYLAGKLFAAFLTVTALMVFIVISIGLVLSLVSGAPDLSPYLGFVLFGILPVATINSLLAVLLAAGQPTRRRAFVIGGAFAIVSLLLLPLGFVDSSYGANYFNPGRTLVLMHYMQQLTTIGNLNAAAQSFLGEPITHMHLLFAALAGALQVALGYGIALRWLRRSTERG